MINYVKIDKFLMSKSMGAMFAGNKGLGKFLRQEAEHLAPRIAITNSIRWGTKSPITRTAGPGVSL